jgi:hypothetical protein
MITKKILEQMQSQLEIMDNHRKFYENQQITSILKYFGIPENKSESIKSISDYLEFDLILIFMPNSVFKTIDFSKLFLPEKIKFVTNYNNESWIILGQNREDLKTIKIEFDSNENHRLDSFGRSNSNGI